MNGDICEYRFCKNTIRPPRRIFCSKECRTIENRLIQGDVDGNVTEIGEVDYYKNECKYCKDSNHSTFCSDKHRQLYHSIMGPIDNALDR